MGVACNMRGRDEKCIQNLHRKTRRKENVEDLGVDGNIILEWILGKWEDVDCMHLTQDVGQWRAVVNTVINLRGPSKEKNFLTSWQTISYTSRCLLRCGTCSDVIGNQSFLGPCCHHLQGDDGSIDRDGNCTTWGWCPQHNCIGKQTRMAGNTRMPMALHRNGWSCYAIFNKLFDRF